MLLFRYQAKNIDGTIMDGTIEARDLASAADKLRQRQLFITFLQPENTTTPNVISKWKSKDSRQKVNTRHLIIFCRQLAALLQAGVPILSALNVLTLQSNHKVLKATLGLVMARLEAGHTLTSSLQKFPAVFPKLMVGMVEAGEYSGQLERVLFNIADYLEQQRQIKTKVRNALLYPAIICTIALLMALLMIIFVLPRYANMIQSFGIEMPLITQILISISNFIRQFWPGILLGILFFIYTFYRFKSTARGGIKLDRLLLRLPLAGELVQKLLALQFTRTLAVLLQAGVPLLTALQMTEKTINNKVLAQGLAKAQSTLQQGGSLTATLQNKNILPPAVLQLLTIGEQTGQLVEMLHQGAAVTALDIKTYIERISPVLEPVLLILASVFVGVMIIAVMLPIFKGLGTITGY